MSAFLLGKFLFYPYRKKLFYGNGFGFLFSISLIL